MGDLNRVSLLCILGSVVVLAMAVIFRLQNLEPLLQNPVPALWRVSVILALLAIAIGVNRK